MKTIIYLHGFNSSPASAKAQQLARLMAALGCLDQLILPALANDPAQAVKQIEDAIGRTDEPLLVGSSLGGFYATYFAQTYGLEALLINPAVAVDALFEERLGVQHNYHDGSQWELTQAHIDTFKALQVPPPQAGERIEVWLQTGDQTLDYRHAAHYYQGCKVAIEQGGDHSYQGFAEKLGQLLQRAQLPEALWRDFDFSTLDTRPHGTDL